MAGEAARYFRPRATEHHSGRMNSRLIQLWHMTRAMGIFCFVQTTSRPPVVLSHGYPRPNSTRNAARHGRARKEHLECELSAGEIARLSPTLPGVGDDRAVCDNFTCRTNDKIRGRTG